MPDDPTPTPPNPAQADAPNPPAASPAQPAADAPPAFDASKVAANIAAELKNQLASEPAAQPPQAGAAPAPQPAAPQADPLGELIKPYVEPGLKQAGLAAAVAVDAATFYGSTPEAIEFKDELEKAQGILLQHGIPFTREDIWFWYKGKNAAVFQERAAKKAKEAADAAAAAAHVGPGSPPHPSGVQQAGQMNQDDLGKALEGVSF